MILLLVLKGASLIATGLRVHQFSSGTFNSSQRLVLLAICQHKYTFIFAEKRNNNQFMEIDEPLTFQTGFGYFLFFIFSSII